MTVFTLLLSHQEVYSLFTQARIANHLDFPYSLLTVVFGYNFKLHDYPLILSVPARLGKGQGAKEIGHNLACERPKFGHNLVVQTTQNLLRVNDKFFVLWAIDENMGTNLQAFCKHFYIGCLKTQKQQLHFVKIKIKLLLFFWKLNKTNLIRAGRV